MVQGWIDATDTTARIPLRLEGPLGAFDLIFEIDTGFYGMVMLPFEWTDLMTSDYSTNMQGLYLADGTRRVSRVCTLNGTLLHGTQQVEVIAVATPLAAPGTPQPLQPFAVPSNRRSGKPSGLIGRQLLSASKLEINWIDGIVRISA